jgi:hypothetical protein
LNKVTKQLINVLSWVLIAAGGISFFVGGRALHELAGIDRFTGEVEGVVAAVVLLALGMGLRAAAGLPMIKD